MTSAYRWRQTENAHRYDVQLLKNLDAATDSNRMELAPARAAAFAPGRNRHGARLPGRLGTFFYNSGLDFGGRRSRLPGASRAAGLLSSRR